MKIFILLIPTLFPLLCALALAKGSASQAETVVLSTPLSAEVARAQIDQLRARLSVLEAVTHHVVPRGLGPELHSAQLAMASR